ncbi:MAG: sensor histidine kinase [Desulfococcaceae bacterium]
MKLGSGITGKFLGWYSLFVLIYFGTVLVLYINVHRMMNISETIVNRHDKISSAAKRIFENLLSMEEHEKKFALLKKNEYRDYFILACREFETNLSEIIQTESGDKGIAEQWKELEQNYRSFDLRPKALSQSPDNSLWIPEDELDKWRRLVAEARTRNEQDMEMANLELNRRGSFTVRSGLAGLGISVLIGLLGSLLLAHSMLRPLRELSLWIRGISYDRPIDPIVINSKDEFGELASAFNEMAFRLRVEQGLRSDFISMLSHEIRTPLTSIRESVNLIREGLMGSINERQGKFLEIAGTEIGRVCDLLNRVMQVSYLESGALDLHPSRISPLTVAERSAEQIRSSAEFKGISLEIQIPSDIPDVSGDEKYLAQVFSNLLGNAIKFSPPGSKITVSADRDTDPSNVLFSVSDNGPGINADELPFIFNRYYRAKGVREHTDGTGLGLSIARHIVEAHRGKIRVISKAGKGTAFLFTLPAASESGEQEQESYAGY